VPCPAKSCEAGIPGSACLSEKAIREAEILLAGENACYLLPAFIPLKTEMNRRKTKTGKVSPDLPLYKKFTQLC